MSIIRESLDITPIITERVDMELQIHRYNFGWVQRHTVVGDGPVTGEITEASSTMMTGVGRAFAEMTGQTLLPPSLEVPEATGFTGTIGIEIGTYSKIGSRGRVSIRTHILGEPSMNVMGFVDFSVIENKTYNSMVGSPNAIPVDPPAPPIPNGGGGIRLDAAGGVQTKTIITG